MKRHTLSVLLEDQPGALTRVTGLLARRMFNIHSMVVEPTQVPGETLVTLVVLVEDSRALDQVTKQLGKLINVLEISDITEGA